MSFILCRVLHNNNNNSKNQWVGSAFMESASWVLRQDLKTFTISSVCSWSECVAMTHALMSKVKRELKCISFANARSHGGESGVWRKLSRASVLQHGDHDVHSSSLLKQQRPSSLAHWFRCHKMRTWTQRHSQHQQIPPHVDAKLSSTGSSVKI